MKCQKCGVEIFDKFVTDNYKKQKVMHITNAGYITNYTQAYLDNLRPDKYVLLNYRYKQITGKPLRAGKTILCCCCANKVPKTEIAQQKCKLCKNYRRVKNERKATDKEQNTN